MKSALEGEASKKLLEEEDEEMKKKKRKRGGEEEEDDEKKKKRDLTKHEEHMSSEEKVKASGADREVKNESMESLFAKRKQRMMLWKQQRKQLADLDDGDDEAGETTKGKKKMWSLEDEGDDENDDDGEEGGGDGLGTNQGGEEEEVDPLDAFMAAEVMPEVERLKKEDEEKQKCTDQQEEIDRKKTASQNGKTEGGGDPSTTATASAAATTSKGVVDGKAASEKGERGGVGRQREATSSRRRYNYYDSDSSNVTSEEESESEDDEEWAKNVVSGKGSKLEKLIIVDHSKIDYMKFRKNFFIESPEIAKMTPQDVAAYRKELDNIKVRGKNIPKPIKDWHQCGLSTRVLQVIKLLKFDKPMPIQSQALPVIMQGRDCLGIANTGSGKTMAFVLPMLRHIKDQPPLKPGEGPVGVIMAPTRELVQQIGKDIKKFAKSVNLRLVCVYGGSGVSDQIAALKRGAEIVVCTPGRMIDILAMGSGNRITNMRRVTYLVLDEADRMFDMGFEPQIKRILNMIRPDRQTVMFSATFPKPVEALAKLALAKPVEILVGGRSIVNKDIEQIIEVRPEEQRFLRLLELLGYWYERGKVLVFVASQAKCDNMFRDLLRAGYPCMSLHGGKDQSDRECTINDFKTDVCNVLIATSVAARGLDVKDLQLVVNYDVPNHHEDYVHRVGRTGRAGNKGTAVTFIAPDEEKFAPDLVKALKESGKPVPEALQEMADDFHKKFKQGLVKGHGSGFGGSGFKFDEEEEKRKKAARKRIMAQHGTVVDSESDSEKLEEEEEDQDIRVVKPPQVESKEQVVAAAAAKTAAAVQSPQALEAMAKQDPEAALRAKLVAAAQAVASRMAEEAKQAANTSLDGMDAASRAAAIAARFISGQHGGPAAAAAPSLLPFPPPQPLAVAAPAAEHYSTEIEVNDFPQQARWKVTEKGAITRMSEEFDVAITARGVYVAPGKQPREGERKLYLLIEGPMERGVKLCKAEIKKIIQATTERTLLSGSRYQI